MQGRLSPPVGGQIQAFPLDSWADEFPTAGRLGLDAVEWIYDAPEAEQNPLSTADGRARIRDLAQRHGVAVKSVCADYFMRRRLIHGTPDDCQANAGHLDWLLDALA